MHIHIYICVYMNTHVYVYYTQMNSIVKRDLRYKKHFYILKISTTFIKILVHCQHPKSHHYLRHTRGSPGSVLHKSLWRYCLKDDVARSVSAQIQGSC